MIANRSVRGFLGGLAALMVAGGALASLYLVGLPLYLTGLVLLALALGKRWHALLPIGTALMATVLAWVYGSGYLEDRAATAYGTVAAVSFLVAIAAWALVARRLRTRPDDT